MSGPRHTKVPVAAAIGATVALAAPAIYAYNQGGSGASMIVNYFRGLAMNSTGYDPVANQWNTSGLKNFYGPLAVGGLASYIAAKSGFNRLFRGLPFKI